MQNLLEKEKKHNTYVSVFSGSLIYIYKYLAAVAEWRGSKGFLKLRNDIILFIAIKTAACFTYTSYILCISALLAAEDHLGEPENTTV